MQVNRARVAIVYDRLNTFGGAERVLLALHDIFPRSVLFSSVRDNHSTKWLGDWEVRTSFLQRFPLARTRHQIFGWLMPVVFESLDLSEFDIVISVTSESAKGVITTPDQLHLCYCLTPTRYLWSHTHEYAGTSFRWLKRMFFTRLREWDYIAAQRPDVLIPISKRVQARVEKFYRRKAAEVIYPPVDITDHNHSMAKETSKKYFLVVSRLVSYKRIDLVIKACIQKGYQLKIVGRGKDAPRLHRHAHTNSLIEFCDFVDEKEMEMMYSQAIALVCAQEEDFGIVGVEAQSHGTPVVTYTHSGVAETITPDETGIIFAEQTVDSIAAALEAAEKTQWDRTKIRASIQHFSRERFAREIQQAVQSAIESYSINAVL